MWTSMILSAEAEAALLKPIDEYVEKYRSGSMHFVYRWIWQGSKQNHIAIAKEDKNLTRKREQRLLAKDKADLEKAKSVESANKDKVSKLISDAESYLSKHYKVFYEKVVASCEAEGSRECLLWQDCGNH